jgi:hypothetical protein
VLAEAFGVNDDDVRRQLAGPAERGLVVHRDGRVSGWMLTPGGKSAVKAAVRAQSIAESWEVWLVPAYVDFLELNEPMKELCTTWQLEDQPESCVAALADVHTRLTPVLSRLAANVPWFGSYLPRFDAALDRLRAGDRDALTRPLSGSYHDVWMELHQDLLLALGRERSSSDGH